MPTTIRSARKKFSVLEKELATQRNELRLRMDRHRMEVLIEREPDDEAAAAVESVSKDMTTATLERERRTLYEIESALTRIKKGEYGVCNNCGDEITPARLEALPWARLCLRCAERASNPGGLRAAS
jgi:DnaK suppressor protein